MTRNLRRTTRLLAKAGLALLFLGPPACIAYAYFTFDEPPPDDSYLLFVRGEVPTGQNGFPLVDMSGEDIVWPGVRHEELGLDLEETADEMAVRGEKWDKELATKILEKNRESLRRFDECLKLPHFQGPEIKSHYDSMGYALGWQRMAPLITLRAWSCFLEGREREAFEEAMTLIRFGHKVEGSQGYLLTMLSGQGIKWMGVECLLRMLVETKLEPRELAPLVGKLAAFSVTPKSIDDAVKLQYMLMAKWMDEAASGSHDVAEFLAEIENDLPATAWVRRLCFKPNQTKRFWAEASRKILETLKEPGACVNRYLTEMTGQYTGSWWLTRNSAGKHLVHGLLPTLERGFREYLMSDLQLTFAQALIAIKCHKLAKGDLPAVLEDLVPEYLAAVPTDPFDGKPLRYLKDKKILYSVGEDLTDAGGNMDPAETDPQSDRNEPTSRIAF